MKNITMRDKWKFAYHSILNRLNKNRSSIKVTAIIDPYYVYSKDSLKNKRKMEFNEIANRKIGEDIKNNYNLMNKLDKLNNFPIMVAQGSSDIIRPSQIKELLVDHIHSSQLIEIEEAGHWTIIEQPVKMIRITRNFF